MPTCQYFGQTDCVAPTFGGGSGTIGPHENFVEHYLMLGTSPSSWLINGVGWLLIIRFVLWPFIIAPLLNWLDYRRQQQVKRVAYELIPHHVSSVSAEGATEFFKILHTQYALRSYEDHVLQRKQLLICEVISTREGIHYIARVPKDGTASFERVVESLQHEIDFKKIDGRVEGEAQAQDNAFAVSFRQMRSFAYPLRRHTALGAHDPATYLTSALAKPKQGEVLALQFVLSPYTSRRAARIRNKLTQGKNPWLLEFNSALPINLFLLVCKWTVVIALFAFNMAAFVINAFEGKFSLPAGLGGGSSGTTYAVPAVQALRDSMIDKLGEPLFYADVRAFISVQGEKELDDRIRGISGALATFDEPGYQSLVLGNKIFPPLISHVFNIVIPAFAWERIRELNVHKFVKRLPSIFTFNSNVLSVSEIANLYHFPYEQAVTTEGMVRSMSRTLAAPNAIELIAKLPPSANR